MAPADPIATLRARLDALDEVLARYPDPWGRGSPYAFVKSVNEDLRRMHASRPPKGRPTPEFLARADAFLQALAIAERVSFRRESPDARRGSVSNAKSAVEYLRIGHVRTLAGLAYLETELLTYYWEGRGPDVTAFWREVARARLPYERRDLLAEIREAGRIRTREHYEFAVDAIGTLRGRAAVELSRMIGAYESRGR